MNRVEIMVGASAADIRGSLIIDLASTLELGSLLNPMSTLGDWLADPRGREVSAGVVKPALAAMIRTIGGDPEAGELDPILNLYLTVLPLADVLAFGGDAVHGDPVAIVASLLAEVRG